MSRSHKEQRARLERERAERWVNSFNASRPGKKTPARVQEFIDTLADEERHLRNEGPFDATRYGNQRKARAQEIVKKRREDRHGLPDPMLDQHGEQGLASQAPKRPRR